VRTRQRTLYVVALIEKQLEFTTARALLRDSQGALARVREQNPPPRVRVRWTS
jgi:hypothetical protein